MYPFIIILFFFSGFASLIYEILWTRFFGLMIGNTTLAVSCVLAAFFSGLALGGRYFGKRADAHASPMRLFAFLEVGILAGAVLLLLLRWPIEALLTWFHPRLLSAPSLYYLIKFIIAFAVMLPSTFFMGGTLPVISRAFIRFERPIGRPIGLLYGMNTLGAVIGCLSSAFIFLRLFGMTTTYLVAMGVDVLIAGAAWSISHHHRLVNAAYSSTEPPVSGEERVILAAMALSGFIALSYEILWSRVLVFILTNATYSFSIMLAAFLFSLAVGGFLGGRWADRSKTPLRLLGFIEIGVGIFAALAIYLLIKLPIIHNALFAPSPITSWWQWNGIRFLEAFLVTSLAAVLLGVTFPVAVKSLAIRHNRLGGSVGNLYFYNTLGGVLGSALTGLVFISLFGTAACMNLMIILNIALGTYLLLRQRGIHIVLFSALTLGLACAAVRFTPRLLFTRSYSMSEKDYPLIAMREGIEGTVTVHQHANGIGGEKRIDVDGLNVAGSSFMLRTLQLLQGHLPLFVSADAESVMQIGFGTGQTSYAALLHPIHSFELVEISPDVLRLAAEQFRELNHDVMQDPRFQPLILDGKNQVKYSRDRYDVIMNDANYAVATASASLFTRDHFELGRQKLNRGGVFSTWMTTDLHPQDFQIVLKTFQSVFPHAVLWMAPNCVNKQVVLMGSSEPLVIDWRKWNERFAQTGESLAEVNILSPYDLMACLLIDEQGMARLCRDAKVNTDDRPILEFSTRDVRARDLCAFQNLSAMLSEPPNWQQYVRGLPESSNVRTEAIGRLERTYGASRLMFQGILQFYQGQTKKALETMLNSSRLIPESRLASGFYKEMDQLTLRLHQTVNHDPGNSAHRLTLARHYIGLERYDEAGQQLRHLLEQRPDDPFIAYDYARCLLQQGKLDSARVWSDRCLLSNESFAGGWFLAGLIAEEQNQRPAAIDDFKHALTTDPRMHEAYSRIGRLYLEAGDYTQAATYLTKSLDLVPFQSGAVRNLADCYLFRNQPDPAIHWYQKVIQMGDADAKLYHNLGNALFLRQDYKAAVQQYQKSLQLQPSNAEVYYNLGNAFVRLNEDRKAVATYEQAIRLNTDQPDYFNNLALVRRKMGDLQSSLQVFAQGLRRHPASDLLRKNQQETMAMFKQE